LIQTTNTEPREIALEELDQGVIPITVKRK